MAIPGHLEACGDHLDLPIIELGKGGGLKNAVVFIAEIDRGLAIDKTLKRRLDHRHCRFVPPVLSLSVWQVLELTSTDRVVYRTRALRDDETVFEVALPLKNMRIDKRLTRPGLVHLESAAAHPWMRAWVHVFEHPYHAVTGDKGGFEIESVPPGTYRLVAWHEELGTQTLDDVRVGASERTTVGFDDLRRPDDTDPPEPPPDPIPGP